MKSIPFEVGGRTVYLCLNGQALFDFYDKFGYDASISTRWKDKTKQTFEEVCWMLSKLAEQGELVRRWQGHDRQPIMIEQFFRANISVYDVPRAWDAVLEAVNAGFEREEKDEKRRRDAFAEEYQKKNGNDGVTRSWWIDLLTQFLHLSIREGMLLTPGQVLDMQEIETKRRGLRKAEDGWQ